MNLPRLVTASEGVALVEFALMVPVLILLLVGILDTGRAVNAYVTISNASREGARYAALNPTAAPSAIKSSAVLPHAQQLDPSDLTGIRVYVTYSNANVTSTACPVATTTAPPASSPSPVPIPVRVDVTYPWSAATFFIGQFFGGGSRTFCASSTVDTVR